MASSSAAPMQPDMETCAGNTGDDQGANGDGDEDQVSMASAPVVEEDVEVERDAEEDSGSASSKENKLMEIILLDK